MLITQGSLVRNQPDPPSAAGLDEYDNAIPGGLAQLGEHLLCKQGVVGSIPSSSTNNLKHKLRKNLNACNQHQSSFVKGCFDVDRYISINRLFFKNSYSRISVADGNCTFVKV